MTDVQSIEAYKKSLGESDGGAWKRFAPEVIEIHFGGLVYLDETELWSDHAEIIRVGLFRHLVNHEIKYRPISLMEDLGDFFD